jgi:glutamate-1-semialdehyde 2,1-aminomutase
MTIDATAPAREAIVQAYQDRTPRSRAHFEEAARSLPGGVTRSITFHPPHPVTLARGEGAKLLDVDGNTYLDLQNNYTALVHGHSHPAVVDRVVTTARSGVVHNAPIPLQRELARLLQRRVASVELVRFTNSGTEAVMNALRLARAHTGRSRILKMEGAFHGSFDGVALSVHPGSAPPPPPTPVPEVPGLVPGIEEGVLVAPYNDLEGTVEIVEAHRGGVAAVIVEALTWAPGGIPADPTFLTGIEELCREHGIIFILDEVVTFRLAAGGAQEAYGVTPDLTIFGKVIGGGLPIGAVGGRDELMSRLDPRREGYLPQSGTFSGSPLSMAAGATALGLLDEEAVAALNRTGAGLRRRLSMELEGAGFACTVTGDGSLGYLHLGPGPIRDYRTAGRANRGAHRWLHLALLNRGVFMDSRGHFALSTAMTSEDVEGFVTALLDAVEEIRPFLDA